jgi:hypothetical protein
MLEGDGGNRKYDLEERLLGFASAVIDLSENVLEYRGAESAAVGGGKGVK